MAPRRDNRLKVSALLHARHKESEVTNFVGVSRTAVYAIKKRMDDGKDVNRHTGSGRAVVDRGQLVGCHCRDCFLFGMPFEGQ